MFLFKCASSLHGDENAHFSSKDPRDNYVNGGMGYSPVIIQEILRFAVFIK